MDILLDNPEIEKQFREILAKIRLLKNGETSAQMKALGVKYKLNWGASIISLRDLSKDYEKNHLLALKLWNKKWRESMIVATLLDEPNLLTEEQMDYWVKSFETVEMVEQAVANLFVHSKFAYAKALEWCRGKKHLVRYAGIQLMGRLAMVDKKSIDEMFDPFFEVLLPLTKDESLSQVLYRSLSIMIYRSGQLEKSSAEFLKMVSELDEEPAKKLANLLLDEISDLQEE